jgi:hypothetical protein
MALAYSKGAVLGYQQGVNVLLKVRKGKKLLHLLALCANITISN